MRFGRGRSVEHRFHEEVRETMRKHIATAMAAAAMAWLGGNATAGDQLYVIPQNCGTTADCCATGTKGGWYGSVGVLFLKEVGTRDLAYETRVFDQTPPPDGPLLQQVIPVEFSHSYRASGRFELGWKSDNGLGIRGRFFWIHDSASTSLEDNAGFQNTAEFPNLNFSRSSGTVFQTSQPLGTSFSTVGTETAPSIFTTNSRLRLQSWDLEATSDCHYGALEMTWSAGLRWLHIAQDYQANETVINPGDLLFPDITPIQQSLTSGHNLNAFGPTIGLEGRYPVTSNLKALAQARFGLLYAKGTQSVFGSETPLEGIPTYTPTLALNYNVAGDRCVTLPVGELELGAEYSKTIGCNGPELFIRGTVLSQAYWGAGRAARVNFNNNPSSEDLIFFGFAVDVGIRY
jgi:hypothetical protein